jgi:hypothetical protein
VADDAGDAIRAAVVRHGGWSGRCCRSREMEFRALRRELVDTGMLTEKAHHDAVVQNNRTPVTMARAA